MSYWHQSTQKESLYYYGLAHDSDALGKYNRLVEETLHHFAQNKTKEAESVWKAFEEEAKRFGRSAEQIVKTQAFIVVCGSLRKGLSQDLLDFLDEYSQSLTRFIRGLNKSRLVGFIHTGLKNALDGLTNPNNTTKVNFPSHSILNSKISQSIYKKVEQIRLRLNPVMATVSEALSYVSHRSLISKSEILAGLNSIGFKASFEFEEMAAWLAKNWALVKPEGMDKKVWASVKFIMASLPSNAKLMLKTKLKKDFGFIIDVDDLEIELHNTAKIFTAT